MFSDFRKMEMMDYPLTGLRETLPKRKLASGPQPTRVLPVLSPADVYAFVMKVTLDPPSFSRAWPPSIYFILLVTFSEKPALTMMLPPPLLTVLFTTTGATSGQGPCLVHSS